MPNRGICRYGRQAPSLLVDALFYPGVYLYETIEVGYLSLHHTAFAFLLLIDFAA